MDGGHNTMSNPVGRPPIKEETIKAIIRDFDEYIDNHESIPTHYEFWSTIAHKKYGIALSTFYDKEEFSESRKKCNEAQKDKVIRLGLFNVINATMAIFLLKNLGMSDRQDINMSGATGIEVRWQK
jgi:hypothetical protein